MSEEEKQDRTLRPERILGVLARCGLVKDTVDALDPFERQPEEVTDAIKDILYMVGEHVAEELNRTAEGMYFQTEIGARTLNSREIMGEVSGHMTQTGPGFKPKHSNAHLVAAMSDALDWIGDASAREMPTVHELVRTVRKLGKGRQGH